MKGMVFTEFLEMVQDVFGEDTADRIIDESDLPSGGVYTAVGTYDHSEMVQLVTKLSEATGTAVPDLIRAFGQYLFGRFAANYGMFFEGVDDTFVFLSHIDDYIHVEVRKLYPDAELPKFEHTLHDADHMDLIYRSKRPFADLAEGLIIGCCEHFGERIGVVRENLEAAKGETAVKFMMHRQPGSAADLSSGRTSADGETP